jgi:hypothetical protein
MKTRLIAVVEILKISVLNVAPTCLVAALIFLSSAQLSWRHWMILIGTHLSLMCGPKVQLAGPV